MTYSSALYLCVPVAVAAAASFGLTGTLQQQATKQVPNHRALSPQLVADLLHRPIWLLSVLLTVVGVALQLLALSTGPLIVVQTLLVLDVPFAVIFGAALAHRSPDRVFLLGGLAAVLGLALFLALSRPTGGTSRLSTVSILPLAAGLAAILAVCLATAARRTDAWRVLALASATGVMYGVTAGLMKAVTDQLREGLATPFGQWPLYAVCVVGPLGFLLSQNTYQAGRFVAPALAVITVLDPLVGIGIGVLWLGETLQATPASIGGQVVALAIMAGGIVILARRAPQVRPLTGDPVPEPARPSRRRRPDPAAP